MPYGNKQKNMIIEKIKRMVGLYITDFGTYIVEYWLGQVIAEWVYHRSSGFVNFTSPNSQLILS